MTFRHWHDARYMISRISHGRSNIYSSVIAPLFLFLFPSLSSSMMSVSLSVCEALANTDVRMCREWNYLSRPDFLLRVLQCTPNGISFSFALASKRFTQWAQFKPPWKRHRASRPRRIAQLRTGQSTSEFTVMYILASCCRVLLFHVRFLWIRKQHSSIALSLSLSVSLSLSLSLSL